MAVSTIRTVLVPTVIGDQVTVDFYRGDDHYIFSATVETVDKSLRLIEQCAENPELSLTVDDADHVEQVMKKLLPMPAPAEPDDSWLSWAIIVSGAICVWLFFWLI